MTRRGERRREIRRGKAWLVSLWIGSAAAGWPLPAAAQQPATPVIGFLHIAFPAPYAEHLAAFRQGLRQSGWIDGQNVTIEYRWANNEAERLPELAADLVRRHVDVIVAGGGPTSALAAKAATATTPIVVVFGADPVRLGLITSMNRPGGNITGVSFLTTDLIAKRLDLLHELNPKATTIGILADARAESTQDMLRDAAAAASQFGLTLAVVQVRSDHEFEAAFATMADRKAEALIVAPSQLFDSNRDKLVALAALQKLPAIYQAREYVVDGGLMSYGASYPDVFRGGGLYAGQILKGDKPGNLPFQQATKLELVVNLKTAKAMGLDVPLSLMIRADDMIE